MKRLEVDKVATINFKLILCMLGVSFRNDRIYFMEVTRDLKKHKEIVHLIHIKI